MFACPSVHYYCLLSERSVERGGLDKDVDLQSSFRTLHYRYARIGEEGVRYSSCVREASPLLYTVNV